MYVTTEDGRIEYVATSPYEVESKMYILPKMKLPKSKPRTMLQ
ncbi:hypothetical protein [Capnocytophaga catalasegens]|nr:hypothetical protein [Capnocytophaga catalasegens]